MNKNLLVSILLPVFLCSASIQTQAQHTVKGKVSNTAQQPISYASVMLLQNKDSVVLQTSTTDETGQYLFLISDLTDKAIKVSAMGYDAVTQNISNVEVLDIVLLESNTNLDEVSISSAKPIFERKIDRMVYNVANSITTAGSTALEVLRKTPGVLMQQQDNTISLIGKSAVQVLINDRLLQLDGEDLMAYLQAIPSENIERVEVITTPPAKYDAAGNSGLINIVLKKNNSMGMNGNLRAGLEHASLPKVIMGADVNYRHKSLNFYGNINYSKGANNIAEQLNTPYSQQNFIVKDNYKRILKPLAYTLGLDYELHKGGIIGLQWTGNIGNRINESESGIEVQQRYTAMLDSAMMTHGYSTVKTKNNVFNLNYTWNIDSTGKKLSINGNQLLFSGRRNNNFETTHYLDPYTTPSGLSSHNKSDGNQDIDIKTLQVDVDLPYTFIVLAFGGKLSFINNKSANHFGKISQGIYEENPAISNSFNYTEKVQALYMNAHKTLGKWAFQLGLRGERTQTIGYSLNLNTSNANQYFNLFPTAYVQYQLNDKHNWNLNYSKRINRPDYRSLDPFRAYATPYHYNEGNPFLLPSFNHNTELTYTYNTRYSLSAYYQYERNHFGAVWFADAAQNITSGQSMNFANMVNYGLNAATSFQPAGFLDIQLQASLQQQQLKSMVYVASEQSYNRWMYYLACNTNVALNKDKTLLAEANVYYLSKSRFDFLEINPYGSLDIGLRCLLWQKKLGIHLAGNDVLATQRYKGKHIVTGQIINNYFDTRNVRLSLSYKVGNHKLKEKRNRTMGIEDEQERAR